MLGTPILGNSHVCIEYYSTPEILYQAKPRNPLHTLRAPLPSNPALWSDRGGPCVGMFHIGMLLFGLSVEPVVRILKGRTVNRQTFVRLPGRPSTSVFGRISSRNHGASAQLLTKVDVAELPAAFPKGQGTQIQGISPRPSLRFLT